MTGINVNKNLCAQCGICANVCPLMLINLGDENLPMKETEHGKCINCGHCEAFCQSGALTLNFTYDENSNNGVESEESPLNVPSNLLGNYLKNRRSIRYFNSKIVEKWKIREIMDIVRYSASGINAQPVRWIVVYEKKEVQKLVSLTVDWMRYLSETNHPMNVYTSPLIEAWENGFDFICWNAPHILINYVPENSISAPTDAIIALTHFDITAPTFGLGTCWAGFLTAAARSWAPLQESLTIPVGCVIGHAMIFGYPKYKQYKFPRRNSVQITWK